MRLQAIIGHTKQHRITYVPTNPTHTHTNTHRIRLNDMRSVFLHTPVAYTYTSTHKTHYLISIYGKLCASHYTIEGPSRLVSISATASASLQTAASTSEARIQIFSINYPCPPMCVWEALRRVWFVAPPI